MVSHPHNEILLWMVEGGITAVVAILLVCLGTLLVLWQVGKTRSWAYLGLMLPLVLHMQVELPLYMSALDWFLLLVILSLPFRHTLVIRHNLMSIYAKRLSSTFIWLMTVVFTLFLLHTIRANWDFVAFYNNTADRNKPFPYAQVNPALAKEADWINMSRIFNASVKLGVNQNVTEFMHWTEQKLHERPDVDIYKKLAESYIYMNQMDKFCHLVMDVNKMYPRDKFFEEAKTQCQN
jgi:O-antigen polymerase